jgi:carbon monoxide dehydrogenase subunit G
MELEGTFTIHVPRAKVFDFFMDPHALSACISDPHTLEVVDESHFRGQIKSGIGFIRGTFTGVASIEERNPPSRARIKAHGSGMGNAFDIESEVSLTQSPLGVTTVRWKARVQISGSIASMGARVLTGTIDKKTNEFFDNVRAKLEPR